MCAEAELGPRPHQGLLVSEKECGGRRGPSRQPQAFGEIIQLLPGKRGSRIVSLRALRLR